MYYIVLSLYKTRCVGYHKPQRHLDFQVTNYTASQISVLVTESWSCSSFLDGQTTSMEQWKQNGVFLPSAASIAGSCAHNWAAAYESTKT